MRSRRKEVAKIAGCRVEAGSLQRGAQLFRLMRGDRVVFEGPCASLKRQKLEVEAAGKGSECGVVLGGGDWADVEPGDVLLCLRKESAAGGGGGAAHHQAGAEA
jgi:translation initiation factor IF-2